MAIRHTVTSEEIEKMTLDDLQAFIDECKSVGMEGKEKIRMAGNSSGYHFTGTYTFSPTAIRAGARQDG